MKFTRRFTSSDPYENIKFVEKSSKILGLDGKIIKAYDRIIVPEQWSQTSVDILAQKYARKAGLPKFTKRVFEENVPEWIQKSVPDTDKINKENAQNELVCETDSRQIFSRLVGAWTYWGWKHDYFDSENEAKIFHDELCHMLAMQKAAPNSPQWFNTGLHWAYGIEGEPQGHYFVDPDTLKLSTSSSAYERPQPHACFIQSVADDLLQEGGIQDLMARETRVFKYGSGSGTNFSTLRGESEKLSSGGISSGLISFLIVFDANSGAIKSGGTTRRSAKMVIVDIDHPDIEKFIKWKTEEEDKVVFLSTGSKIIHAALQNITTACNSWDGKEENKYNADLNEDLSEAISDAEEKGIPYGYLDRILKLLQQGETNIDCKILTTEFESEAYSSVSGQNSNNSVRVRNDFMRKVQSDGSCDLVYRTTGEVSKTLPARYLWNEVNKSACYVQTRGSNMTQRLMIGILAKIAEELMLPTLVQNICS